MNEVYDPHAPTPTFKGNLTACGIVAQSVWVAPQQEVTRVLIAHLAEMRRAARNQSACHVRTHSRALT